MGAFVFSVFCAVVPAIAILIYFLRKDPNPEPRYLLLTTFFLGVISVIPIIVIETFLNRSSARLQTQFPDPRFSLAFNAFHSYFVTGGVEETTKALIVALVAYRSPRFNERVDGIMYAIVASLGFATIENIMYVLRSGMGTAIMRAFTAIPLHAVASGIMGYFIGKAKFASRGKALLCITGLLCAIVIHGTYNFLIFEYANHAVEVYRYRAFLIFPLVIGGIIILNLLIRTHTNADLKARSE